MGIRWARLRLQYGPTAAIAKSRWCRAMRDARLVVWARTRQLRAVEASLLMFFVSGPATGVGGCRVPRAVAFGVEW